MWLSQNNLNLFAGQKILESESWLIKIDESSIIHLLSPKLKAIK